MVSQLTFNEQLHDLFHFSLMPAKTCWEAMVRIMKGPQSMALYKGRGKAKSG
jgi:hypothetical protein